MYSRNRKGTSRRVSSRRVPSSRPASWTVWVGFAEAKLNPRPRRKFRELHAQFLPEPNRRQQLLHPWVPRVFPIGSPALTVSCNGQGVATISSIADRVPLSEVQNVPVHSPVVGRDTPAEVRSKPKQHLFLIPASQRCGLAVFQAKALDRHPSKACHRASSPHSLQSGSHLRRRTP